MQPRVSLFFHFDGVAALVESKRLPFPLEFDGDCTRDQIRLALRVPSCRLEYYNLVSGVRGTCHDEPNPPNWVVANSDRPNTTVALGHIGTFTKDAICFFPFPAQLKPNGLLRGRKSAPNEMLGGGKSAPQHCRNCLGANALSPELIEIHMATCHSHVLKLHGPKFTELGNGKSYKTIREIFQQIIF